jgi:hypothetical protein
MSLSQGHYLHTGHYKHRINTQMFMPQVGLEPTTLMFEQSDSSCLRQWGHCDQVCENYVFQISARELTIPTILFESVPENAMTVS